MSRDVYRYGERLVAMIIQECHVVKQWKKDFREDYQSLPELRSLAAGAPWALFSATLEAKALHSLITDLDLAEPIRESSRDSKYFP